MPTEQKERVRVQAGRQGAPKRNEVTVVQQNAPVAAPAPTTLYGAIIAAARDPSVDADKMEKLVDLQMKVEANEARKAFTRAFAALKRHLPHINKDGNIDHGDEHGRTKSGKKALKTRYATYPALMEVCEPLLDEHGFTLSSVIEPSADGVKINVVSYLEHVDGHSRVSRFPLGADASGGKNNNQGWGSSQQYGMRYNAIALLNIVTKDPRDSDNDGYPKPESQEIVLVSMEQAQRLRVAIDECGVGADRFCKKFGVDSIPDLPANKFNDALKACKHYADEKAKHAKTAGPSTDETFPGDR